MGGGGVFPACITCHVTRRVCLGGLHVGGLHPGGGDCIQGVCILGVRQTPRQVSLQRWGLGRPPPRHMEYYGIRSTSGRYVSYWNAFLFNHIFKAIVLLSFQRQGLVMIGVMGIALAQGHLYTAQTVTQTVVSTYRSNAHRFTPRVEAQPPAGQEQTHRRGHHHIHLSHLDQGAQSSQTTQDREGQGQARTLVLLIQAKSLYQNL